MITMHRRAGIRVGRTFGFEARVDWSLAIVFFLVAMNLGAGLFPQLHPEWNAAACWGLGFAAAALFFFSIYAHELAHALVGRGFGVKVESITLFMFGGIAETRREPPSPRADLFMAAAGPIASVLIGVVAGGIGVALAGGWTGFTDDPAATLADVGPVGALLLWLGPVNILLGVFNLIPGYPLDGGRVLRAAFWRVLGDLGRATRWAALLGQGVGLLFASVGVAMMIGVPVPVLGGGLAQGVWMAFIGWFLAGAAREAYQSTVARELLSDVEVSRLMSPAPAPIARSASVADLVDQRLLGSEDRAFPVTEQDELVGLVCLADVRKVPRPRWPHVDVGAIMTGWQSVLTVAPGEDAAGAFARLNAASVHQLPVVSGGRIVGMLRKPDVLRWLEVVSTMPLRRRRVA